MSFLTDKGWDVVCEGYAGAIKTVSAEHGIQICYQIISNCASCEFN